MFGVKYVVLLNFKIYNTQPVVFTAQPLRPFRGVCLDRRLGWTGAVTLLIQPVSSGITADAAESKL
jgi:hypothetical protein